MKKITFLLFALLFSFVGYSQFPTPGTEGFESTTGPDLALPVAVSPWTLGTGATGNQWAVFDNGVAGSPQKRWDRATTNFYNGTQAAFINRKQNGAAGVVSEDYLATPLVTVPANGQLTFYTRTGFNVADAVNYLIKVNTNTTAGSQTTIANYTATVQSWDQTTIATTFNVYELKTVDLSAYAGQQIYIAFVRNFSQPTAALGGNSWYIDDVKLVQRCLEPTSQTATGITQTSASLSWTNPSGSTSWEIEVVSSTGTPTGSGVVYNGTLPYLASGLTPATCYVYFVRSLCSNSNSNWVGPYNFCTATPGLTCASAIAITSLPYSTTDNTANYADTYDVTQPTACAGTATNYMAGNDVFYSYTAPTTGAISITMTPTASNSGIFVYQGCSNVGVTCLAGVANTGNGVRTIPSLNVTAGQTYIIVLSSSATTQTYPYILTIQQLNCASPTALSAGIPTPTGAQLSWTNATSTSWEYVVQPAGSTIPSGSGTQTSSSTNTPVTGLTPDTAYQYWVRADCGNGTFSAWAGPFLFTTAVAPPVCGGLFVDAGGQAGNYANNANITYPICPVNPGDQVTVTFTSFNTQLNTDLLKVYNGNGTSGTLLATYSGTTIPPAVTSSSPDGCLTFVFTSNASTTAAGWVANVTCAPAAACQKPIVLTTSAISYNSVTVGWTQPQNPDTTVASAWEVIALPCGSPAPSASATGVIAAATNPIPVTGLTPLTCYDFYVRAVCSVSSSSLWSGPISATTTVASAVCGGNFVDPGGVAANYPNNANVTTPICPTNPGDQVTVTFTSFNTQLNTDLLKVYDGNGTTGTLLATYSGTTIPPAVTSSSPDGCLTFVFTSNATTTAAGWVANITCAPAPACQKPIALATSAILYNSVTIGWTQPQNPNTTVASAWEVIALPCGSPAPSASATGVVAATTNPFTVTGLSPLTCYNFYVRAVCSSSSSSLWSGPVTATTPIAPPMCGGQFVNQQGTAAGTYPANSDSTVTICPINPGDQVTVTFTTFATETNWDGLYVFDGNSNTAPLLASTNGAGNVPGGVAGSYWGTLTGANLPGPFTASNASGCLTFRFRSDATGNTGGWVANITCAPAPTCPKPTALATSAVTSNSGTLTWTNNSTATQFEVLALPCGSPTPDATSTGTTLTPTVPNTYTFTGLTPLTCYTLYVRAICSSSDKSSWSTGVNITTLAAPPICGGQFVNVQGATAGTYPANSDSTVTICPINPGDQVTVTFTTFATETNWDGLYVFDGNSNTAPLLASTNGAGNVPGGVAGSYWGTLTGANLPGPFTASNASGCLTFRFRSDASVSTGGWLANITCAPAPTCPKPSAAAASAVTSNSGTLTWTNNSTATQFEVLALPCGSPSPDATSTGTIITPTANTYVFSGLTSDTCYTLYVRAVCSSTDSSAWSTGVNITTLITPPACGGTFTDPGGANADYANSSNVTTVICPSTAGQQVTVTFTAFDLESNFDFLKIYDGNSASGALLGNYTGTTLPPSVTSSSVDGCLTFVFTSDSSVTHPGWVASVTCGPPPTCPKPTAVTISNITQNSATIAWTQIGTATSWQVLVLPSGSPLPTATTTGWVTATTNPFTYSGFTSGSKDVYVRAVCSSTDSSFWSNVVSFTTPPPSCLNNTPAGNTCDVATPICNLNGYCGNTSASYTADYWPELGTAFCGSIENNSFLTFVANSTTISFDVWVTSSQQGGGIQIMVFSAATCGSGPVTSLTCWSPGTVASGAVNVSATGLTVGNTYYIMIDGFAGDVCDYVIASSTGIQSPVLISPSTQTNTSTICLGQSATLNASGGNGQYTWSPATNLSATTGSSVVFSPTAIGTYTLTATSTDNNPLCPQSASSSQTITVTSIVTPTFTQIPAFCAGTTAPVLPLLSNDATPITGTWSPSVVDNTTVGITHYTFAPNATQCANPVGMDIMVNPGITPLFLTPAPICSGTTAPVLPLSSTNTPPITGHWSPSTVSNTASGTYTFTPDAGQCASPVTMNVTVNTNCSFGSYANAVWLANCSTSNFFNTVGSGADIIGPAANIFPDSNLGTYIQNSSALLLKGAEVKTFKNVASNVCSARLNYRIYPQAGTPGTFQVMDLPWFSDCGAGSFNNGGGPCNTGDQKWQKVVPNALYPTESPVDLTAYPPGNYTIQVYYDISGSSTTTTGCGETVLIDNNGAYYTASFTIQAQPAYASTNPTTCGGTNGTITISGMAPNTVYGVTYQNATTTVGPLSVSSDNTGAIVINGLNAGTYSNFLVTINGCSYPYNTPIVLVDPTPPSVTVNSPTVCASQPATVVATPTLTGTYSYAWTVPATGTDPGNVATFTTTVAGVYSVVITDITTGCSSTSASGTVGFNPVITPTFAAIAPLCSGTTAPILPTSSTNSTPITGAWLPSTIDSNAVGNTTYTFTPDAGQCSEPISIVVTVNSVPTPTAVVVTQPTCALPTGTVQVTSPVSSLGTTPTDLFISEVTDAETGSLTYIEIFNGTGTSKDLSNYKLKIYNNGNTTTSCDLSLSGIIANNATNVVKVSSDPNQGGVIPNQIFSGCGGINNNDNIRLTTSADVVIDNFGRQDGVPYTPLNQPGYTYRRHSNATALPNPSATWNAADWDAIDPEDYSNVGTYAPFSNAQYNYSVDGGTYQSNPIFTGLTPGVHTITVQDVATGCTSSTTVTLNPTTSIPAVTTFTYTSPVCANIAPTLTPNTSATGFTVGGTYTSTTGLVIDANTGVVNLATSTPGTYIVTYQVNDASCLTGSSTQFTLVINPVPTATVNSPSACAGQPATVIATVLPSSTYNYVWTYPAGATDPGNVATFGATVSGPYTVIATDAVSGCTSASASGTVTINALPTVTVNSPTVCQGQTATVTATPSPSGTYTYIWTVPTGASNPGNVATFNATVAGSYGVTITDTTTGCTSVSVTSTVTINALPTVTVTGDTVCQGAQASITANPSPSGSYNYVWTVPTGVSDPGNVAAFTTATAGTYSVVITNTTTGCSSVSASGTAAFIPAFDFTINGECIDNHFTLEVVPTGSSFDLNTSNYNWQYNSNTVGSNNATFDITSYVNSLTPAPQLPLTFSVNVTTADGCQQNHPITLDRIYCDIQKGISPNPNPDGKNDFFDLRLMNVQTLSIFNRYGTKVYSKGDYTNEWIGQTDSGSELPDGTYYYVIEFKNNQPTKTGWIYINRENK